MKPLIISMILFMQLLVLFSCKSKNAALEELPIFPEVQNLKAIDSLPDAFTFSDGTKVNDSASWQKRRMELKQLFQFYEYGFMPPAPGNVTGTLLYEKEMFSGKALYKYVRLNFGPKNQLYLNLYIVIPKGKWPLATIIRGDRCWESMIDSAEVFTKNDYAYVEFDRTDIDKDDPNQDDGAAPFYPGYDWGTIARWAWGYMRVVDYLQTCNWVDTTKIIVTGHSRGGKATLLAGAFDERIDLVAPNNSGSCGTGPLRLHVTGEQINNITNMFPYWFNNRFYSFRDSNVSKIPIDQHELIALVAPRAYLNTYALADTWANPVGSQRAHMAAKKVFQFLHSDSTMTMYFRPGGHQQGMYDYQTLVEYADWVFKKKKPTRDFNNFIQE